MSSILMNELTNIKSSMTLMTYALHTCLIYVSNIKIRVPSNLNGIAVVVSHNV